MVTVPVVGLTTVGFGSVRLKLAAIAAIGPTSNPIASNPRIFDFMSLPLIFVHTRFKSGFFALYTLRNRRDCKEFRRSGRDGIVAWQAYLDRWSANVRHSVVSEVRVVLGFAPRVLAPYSTTTAVPLADTISIPLPWPSTS